MTENEAWVTFMNPLHALLLAPCIFCYILYLIDCKSFLGFVCLFVYEYLWWKVPLVMYIYRVRQIMQALSMPLLYDVKGKADTALDKWDIWPPGIHSPSSF